MYSKTKKIILVGFRFLDIPRIFGHPANFLLQWLKTASSVRLVSAFDCIDALSGYGYPIHTMTYIHTIDFLQLDCARNVSRKRKRMKFARRVRSV